MFDLHWTEVKDSELNKVRQAVVRNTTIEVYVSPFDVPEAVRAEYDKATDTFVFLLRYIGGEEKVSLSTTDDGVRLFTGRHSGRLRRIEISRARLFRSGSDVKLVVAPKVEAAIGKLEQGARSPQLWNYEMAKTVMANHMVPLLQTLNPTATA
jgi:hypothetical protein